MRRSRNQNCANAAALTVVVLILLGGVALFQFGFLERRTHYR